MAGFAQSYTSAWVVGGETGLLRPTGDTGMRELYRGKILMQAGKA
jgi:hypothetical protein